MLTTSVLILWNVLKALFYGVIFLTVYCKSEGSLVAERRMRHIKSTLAVQRNCIRNVQQLEYLETDFDKSVLPQIKPRSMKLCLNMTHAQYTGGFLKQG